MNNHCLECNKPISKPAIRCFQHNIKNRFYKTTMIHGKDNYPSKPESQPPSEQKLKLLLLNGEAMLDLANKYIKEFKLPYIIEDTNDPDETKRYVLKDTLTQGELYLKSFITVHPETMQMKEYARKMAKSSFEVLITGETGTGKEMIAKSMISDKKGGIRSLNCAGMTETLVESKLFGHMKGSFTGAENTKKGLFQEAEDGVAFLDEVSELPMHLQGYLLRALQEKKVCKVGSNIDEEINCKFVCATNKDLKKMVDEGKFKKDLYARISTLELDILPLRERMEDVIPIAESIKDSKKFLEMHEIDLRTARLDLSLNVRSIQQHIIRFNVLGSVVVKG